MERTRTIRANLILLMLMLLGLLLSPEVAHAAEGDLTLRSVSGPGVTGSAASGYTVYVRDGDTATLDLTVHNDSGTDLVYVTMVDSSTYEEDGETIRPIAFSPLNSYSADDGVAGASYGRTSYLTSETTGVMYVGYHIAAGATATFPIRVSAGNLTPGTYPWYLTLGRQRFDFVQSAEVFNGIPYETWVDAGCVIENVHSARIPIRMVVYNQSGAALRVGTGFSGSLSSIQPLSSSGIDFGTIDLTNDQGRLVGAQGVYVANAGPRDRLADNFGVTTSIGVAFDGEYSQGSDAAFNLSSGDIDVDHWEPLPPVTTTSGGGTSTSTAFCQINYDVTDLIAGTYTANLVVRTTPHRVTINGRPGGTTGEHRFPITLKLTGANPRLLPRATGLTATPGNGTVELTWRPPGAANEYTEYTIYRRTGIETQTDPDKLDWSLYESIGTKTVGSYDDELLFVDGDAANGTTYSYTVIAGNPWRAYAAAPASATPDASIQSRMLAPYSYAGDGENCVVVEWSMNDRYGGSASSGAGMVDHFNIYRNGVLVDQVYQSSVRDHVTMGWHDDGTGTDTMVYGVVSHDYDWSVEEPVDELYTPYLWTVSAVSLTGVESYLDEESTAQAYGLKPVITGHSAYYDPYCETMEDPNNPDEWIDVPGIEISIQSQSGQGSVQDLAFWRSVGTDAPDTSQTPYVVVSDGGYGAATYADTDVRAGQTYTYTVRATDYYGEESDFYTFTVKAITEGDDDTVLFESPNVSWSVEGGTTARLQFNASKNTSVSVFRNDQRIDASPTDEYSVWHYDVQDNPGADGTYVYRVEYTTAGVTTRGRDYTFVRNTQPIDPSSLLQVPDAPTLTARTSGTSNVILSWVPAATGGAPQGYHIYRKDAGVPVVGGRYVTINHWYGPQEVYEQWGNGRYISIEDARTLTFVDGYTNDRPGHDYYKNDKSLGTISGLGWSDDHLPHEYWISAYNRAGESAPSRVVVFDTHDEDEYGNAIAPTSPVEAAPGAPTITDAWVDWEDDSTRRYGFDTAIGGNVRVAWEDAVLSDSIDSWTLTYAGTHYEDGGLNPPQTETLDSSVAFANPAAKQGLTDDAPGRYVDARTGSNGELGRTLSLTVTAHNAAGSTTSEASELLVTSFPRLRALPDNNGALLEWTDLFNDTSTQVNGWEIWRKPARSPWERVAQLPGTLEYAGTEGQNLGYYAWHDDTAQNGWTYQYKVVATCADGIDRSSVTREVTPDRTAAIEAPGAPQNLRAQVANGVVLLTWDAPTTGGTVSQYVVSYEGDWYDGSKFWYGGPTANANSTGAAWTPDKPGTYRLLVSSYGSIDGETVPRNKLPYEIDGFDSLSDEEQLAQMYPTHSNVITVTISQQDIDAQSGDLGDFSIVLTPGDGQVTITWDHCENAASYLIERHNNNYPKMPDATIVAVPGQQSYSWTDDTAESGVRYRYVVTARSSSSIVSHEGYATAGGTTHDDRVARQMESLIDGLPDPSAVTLDDAEDVAAVQDVWESLTDKQRSLVSAEHAQKLADVAAALHELELIARYQELVAPVQAQIDALPDAEDILGQVDDAQVATWAQQVDEARVAYENLRPDEAKRLVDTDRLVAAEEALASLADRKAAAEVAALIETLPEPDALTEGDKPAVEQARAAYDALSDDAKAQVPNYDKLLAAEAAFAPKTSISPATVSAPTVPWSGEAQEPAVTVTLDGAELTQGVDFTVAYDNNVDIGEATIVVTGIGSYEGEATGTFVIDQPFTDVFPPDENGQGGTPHYAHILWLYQSGVTTGFGSYPNRTYGGMLNVIRQDMAAFLFRMANEPGAQYEPTPEDVARFTDVDWNTPHCREIWWLAHVGISEGWKEWDGTYTFRPTNDVVRQDMAAFLHRMAEGPGATYEPTADDIVRFTDVNWDTPHAADIWWLAHAGISEGWKEWDGTATFRGGNTVVRQDMAAFLHRMDGKVAGV